MAYAMAGSSSHWRIRRSRSPATAMASGSSRNRRDHVPAAGPAWRAVARGSNRAGARRAFGHLRRARRRREDGGGGVPWPFADHGGRFRDGGIDACRRVRCDRNGIARRDHGVAARAACLVAAPCLGPTCRIIARLRRGRRASGRFPRRCRIWRSSRSPPSTICGPIIRSACSPCRARDRARIHASSGTTGKPTVVGYTAKRHRYLGRRGGALHLRRRRAAGHEAACRLWLRAVHRRARAHYGAERLGCTVVPVSGGMTERQVQLIADFAPDIIMVTPSYMLAILDEFRAPGHGSARALVQDRHFRRRALDQRDARGNRGRLRHGCSRM